MRLKKIILCGFKSFAQKTEFEFDDGVTVIVGPNGCGKSNIVDGVKWVLGEQSAKSLRGSQMLDVIFNGSSSRKSMGYAEVTLIFSNTRGILSSEFDEVAVCRKLYRSGESVYMLNNKVCRLKDVREMFMDTGIGADAYSIIEQGKVEMMLQASKDDRRAIFEEAAGISKYKARKKEALRKLERTEQNVLRVMDIVAEVEKRLRSIKYQAGKARSYQTYSTRLNELRLNQFLSEYNQLQKIVKQTSSSVTQLQDESVSLTAQTQRAQSQLSTLEHQLDKTNNEIRNYENQILQCTSQISTQQDRIEQGNRRCQELNDNIGRSREQIQSQRRGEKQLLEEMDKDGQLIEQYQGQLEDQQKQLTEYQESRQRQVLELNEYEAQLEDEKGGLIDIVRRTAALHNEISSMDLRRDSLSGQKLRLHDRSGKISVEIEEFLGQRVQLDEKLKQIRQLQQESQTQLDAKRKQMAQLSEDHLACRENLSAAKEYRKGLLSRQELLADMEAKLEGVDQGVRQVLEGQKENPDNFYYVKGMVAQLFGVEVIYADIVENALAGKSQQLVATSVQAVLEDSEKLGKLGGRVGMICLDNLPAFKNGFDFSPYPEVQGKLIDLVKFAPDIEKLAWHLLGKTILVDNIDSAIRLAQVAPAGYRWVTLGGEVLEADGTLHLGPQTGQVGLISRKSELRQLEQSITEAKERIDELQNQSEQYASGAQHLEKNLQELRTAIYEASTEEIETRSRLEQFNQNLARLEQEQPLLSSEIEGLEKQIQEALQLQVTSRKNLDELNDTNRLRQEHIDSLEEKIEALRLRDRELINQITNVKVLVGQTQQKHLALGEKIVSTKSQLQQYRHNISSMQNDLNNAQKNFVDTERSILRAESAIAELFLTRQESQAKNKTLREEYDQLQVEKDQLADQARKLNSRREEVGQQLHEAELQLNENKIRCDNVIQRGRDELSIDLAEELAKHELKEMDWEGVAAEINELRNKISRLGNINLDAISEQEELEKRAEFLNKQSADLDESKRQLERLIEKINVESIERFRVSFEAIRANFSGLFRKLFGGGRADIVLEDPEDILECGIEIIARPPGKQLQSISLLSGGEKTMTAVALLMAIFQSKPSPFCLLDEVDAALDEANVERFNLVIQEFLKDSQFVIITHSRRTMSIADIIYGVTMQEVGVSKKVSVRFAGQDESEDAGSAVA